MELCLDEAEMPLHLLRVEFQPVLLCPCHLHRFVMWINGMGLMVELVQIAGMKARKAEQALAANLHLLCIGLVFQPREFCIESQFRKSG